MTAVLFLDVPVSLLNKYFPPVPLLEQVRMTPSLILGVLDCSLAAAYLALWRMAPDFRAFRSLGIFFATNFLQVLFVYSDGTIPYLCIRALGAGVLIESAADAMDTPARGWTRWFWPIYIFVSVAVWFPPLAFTGQWPVPISEIPLAILIFQGFRRGNARGRMIAAAFAIYFLVRLTLSNSLHRVWGIEPYFPMGGWQWPYTACTRSALGVVTLAILVRDLIRDRSEKQRMAAELAAGRAVQQVLIPEGTPTIPGFTIQSVYKPFAEVGGDFFQVLPVELGGVLVVIGDVSGKGLRAAMTVSAIMGALRGCNLRRPAEVLSYLNHVLLGRVEGFVTCCVAQISSDGAMTIANAGNPAPYRNSSEMPVDPGLPLGLVAESTYTETRSQLARSDRLTFVSDGVLEATNARGELYGFDRTQAISNQPANAIAEAAMQFGQEDDITVLSVTRAVGLNPALA